MLLLSSADFVQNLLFQKNLSGTLFECQTVWIHIRTDILSVLIWVQTVRKGYRQIAKSLLTRYDLNKWQLFLMVSTYKLKGQL